MVENWLPIAEYEGLYDVSDLGRIRSLPHYVNNRGKRVLRNGRILKPMTAKKHHSVALYRNGIRTVRKVHRLVLETFVGPCPVGLEGCHRDDDKSNNKLTNLRWDTASANRKDAVRNGRNHNTQKTKCRNNHPFNKENTRIDPKGHRRCRICERKQALDSYYRRKGN